MSRFWDGFIKRAGISLYAHGVTHDGRTVTVVNADKKGSWHVNTLPRNKFKGLDEHMYGKPLSHKEVASYAKTFSDSVGHSDADVSEESDLHAFADNLRRASGSKKFKHFILHMG